MKPFIEESTNKSSIHAYFTPNVNSPSAKLRGKNSDYLIEADHLKHSIVISNLPCPECIFCLEILANGGIKSFWRDTQKYYLYFIYSLF